MTDLEARPHRPHSRRKPILVAVAVVVVVGVSVGLALFQPWKIFTRSTVDEALPVAATAAAVPTADILTRPIESTPPTAEPPAPTAPAPAVQTVAQPVVLASGTFVDGEHATSGSASLLRLPDGSRFVRLEDFSTSDGPDVHVWITDQQAGGDDWAKYDDGRYLELGDLKGTDGNQNYAVPADAELSGLTSVVIWCDRFNVAFGTAPITL